MRICQQALKLAELLSTSNLEAHLKVHLKSVSPKESQIKK